MTNPARPRAAVLVRLLAHQPVHPLVLVLAEALSAHPVVTAARGSMTS